MSAAVGAKENSDAEKIAHVFMNEQHDRCGHVPQYFPDFMEKYEEFLAGYDFELGKAILALFDTEL